jgi:TPR repeat protein
MYVMGRRAYEAARTSGDFTEALTWSRRLVATGEENGRRLLKMVYLQLGWGAHRDYVQAYVWLSEAIAAGDDYLLPWRKMLVEKMTPEQLDRARKRASQ